MTAHAEPRIELDPPDFAQAIGLRYTRSEDPPGMWRRRCGRGFTYVDDEGTTVPRTDPRRKEVQAMALPPAWSKVWITRWSDGHLQATGYDAAGRKQYRYHERWTEARRDAHDTLLLEFGLALPRLRGEVDRVLSCGTTPTREVVHAAALRLLDHVAIRVGNPASYETFGTQGLTTLTNDEARVGRRNVHLHFLGKGGLEQNVTIRDPELARVLRKAEELDPCLFSYVGDDDSVYAVSGTSLNQALRDYTDPRFHVHMFRGWQATVAAVAALAGIEPVDGNKGSAIINEAMSPVAERLGHTVTMCRNAYVHGGVEEMWRAGDLASLCAAEEVEGLDPAEQITICALRRITEG